ncbi:RDD family protein [Erythrobacter tepidarius]|uniref:RDD family protein n=1 Tax=Erythrobacter tepidarius TaxID=60454 RepID=UPI000A380747|nr:RDD family protein [Erythrobacter tepidarius]
MNATDKRARVILTPEGLALPVRLASRGSRAGALMLDLMLLGFGMALFQLLVQGIAGGLLDGTALDPSAAPRGAQEFLLIVLVIVYFAAWYGYFLVQELGPRGATLGKRIVGIRIAARSGGSLAPEAVIARNLIRDIELFYPIVLILTLLVMNAGDEDIGPLPWVATGWFALFLLLPFFNRDALRAGDIVAGTWVIERPRAKLAAALSAQGAAAAQGASAVTGARYAFGEAELSIYGEKELQTLEQMLRDAPPEALAAVHATICRKIGWNPGAGDERAFLEAFYAQLRAKLEGDMRFGKRKADKFS